MIEITNKITGDQILIGAPESRAVEEYTAYAHKWLEQSFLDPSNYIINY